MKQLFILFSLLFSITATAQVSIEQLEKNLQEASNSRERMSISYQLAEAYLRVNTSKSIDYGKRAYQLASDLKNDGMSAQAAFLVGQGYERDKNDRNAEVWYRSALAAAKQAGDSDLIIKSVENRSRLATKSRDYRKAYQIVEEAFTHFSQSGTSISDLERKYDMQKSQLEREKRRLEEERAELQTEINKLLGERTELSTDRDRLQQRQQQLTQEKQKVEEKISETETELASVAEARQRAERMAEQQTQRVKQLDREVLEKENVLLTQEAELNRAKFEAVQATNRQKLLMLGAAAVIVVAALLLIVLLSSLRSRRQLGEKNKTIQREQQRSEELLLNILPKPIAEELKEYGKAKARRYEQVTVLFSDFINFTSIAEKLSPEELVAELDHCFKGFDFIISQHPEIEKIKTIGDAYMCAAGLTERLTVPNGIVRAALEMQQFLEEQRQEKQRLGKPYFEARIGLHTGPVVAGVVGMNKYAYDIWGDTVNTASRMESNGLEGQVNISETTYGLIKYQFDCDYRGKVQAKNKGLIDMYLVRKEKAKNLALAH
jgi:adenylate cyclase